VKNSRRYRNRNTVVVVHARHCMFPKLILMRERKKEKSRGNILPSSMRMPNRFLQNSGT
jgi:hypothetical protein